MKLISGSLFVVLASSAAWAAAPPAAAPAPAAAVQPAATDAERACGAGIHGLRLRLQGRNLLGLHEPLL